MRKQTSLSWNFSNCPYIFPICVLKRFFKNDVIMNLSTQFQWILVYFLNFFKINTTILLLILIYSFQVAKRPLSSRIISTDWTKWYILNAKSAWEQKTIGPLLNTMESWKTEKKAQPVWSDASHLCQENFRTWNFIYGRRHNIEVNATRSLYEWCECVKMFIRVKL